jgi:hypothetical protein
VSAGAVRRSKVGDIGPGDFVRVSRALGPDSFVTRRAIARILGLDLRPSEADRGERLPLAPEVPARAGSSAAQDSSAEGPAPLPLVRGGDPENRAVAPREAVLPDGAGVSLDRDEEPRAPAAALPPPAPPAEADAGPPPEEAALPSLPFRLEPIPPVEILVGAGTDGKLVDAVLPRPAVAAARGHEGLFNPPWERAILGRALGQDLSSGEPDVEPVLEVLCRGEAVHSLPLGRRASLRRGVQLLLDASSTMIPFTLDARQVEDAVRKVVGSDAVERLRFDGSPLAGAGTGPRRSWQPYRPPKGGRPVLLVSDLGLGDPEGETRTEVWLAFAELVRRAGSRVIALLPFPSVAWPRALDAVMTLIPWDRGTRVGHLRSRATREDAAPPPALTSSVELAMPTDPGDWRAQQAILRLRADQPGAYRLSCCLALATRIDPEVVRRVRLLFGDLTAATEAEAWFSELVTARSAHGLVFAPRMAERLRAFLLEDPELRPWLDRVRAVVEALHADSEWSIRLDEEVAYLALVEPPAGGGQRIEKLLQAIWNELLASEDATNIARWLVGATARFPESVRKLPLSRSLAHAANLRLHLLFAPPPEDAEGVATSAMLGRLLRQVPRVGTALSVQKGALHFGPAAQNAVLVALPQTRPLALQVWSPADSDQPAWHTWREGERIRIPIVEGRVVFATLAGERFAVLLPAPEPPADPEPRRPPLDGTGDAAPDIGWWWDGWW